MQWFLSPSCINRLAATLALKIQIRRLTQGTNSVASTSRIVIVRCTVKGRTVVPDGTVVLVPLESYLGIVVLAKVSILSWRKAS